MVDTVDCPVCGDRFLTKAAFNIHWTVCGRGREAASNALPSDKEGKYVYPSACSKNGCGFVA